LAVELSLEANEEGRKMKLLNRIAAVGISVLVMAAYPALGRADPLSVSAGNTPGLGALKGLNIVPVPVSAAWQGGIPATWSGDVTVIDAPTNIVFDGFMPVSAVHGPATLSIGGTTTSISFYLNNPELGDSVTIDGATITGTELIAADVGEGNYFTINSASPFSSVEFDSVGSAMDLQFLSGALTAYGFVPGALATPEPATWAMLGLGCVAMGTLAFRGRRGATRKSAISVLTSPAAAPYFDVILALPKGE
jgi:PEP-CTERM motif